MTKRPAQKQSIGDSIVSTMNEKKTPRSQGKKGRNSVIEGNQSEMQQKINDKKWQEEKRKNRSENGKLQTKKITGRKRKKKGGRSAETYNYVPLAYSCSISFNT